MSILFFDWGECLSADRERLLESRVVYHSPKSERLVFILSSKVSKFSWHCCRTALCTPKMRFPLHVSSGKNNAGLPSAIR